MKDEARVRPKLESPLGAVERRPRLLKADLPICRMGEEQVALQKDETERDFAARVSKIANIISVVNEWPAPGYNPRVAIVKWDVL